MIDLVNDTVAQPSPEMRKAMAEAEVGDCELDEDPTVNKLLETVCELLGKDAAIFLPSETMANEIAYKVWTQPGDEIIMDWQSYPIHYEAGAPAFLSGVMIRQVKGDRGVFSEEDVLIAIRHEEPKNPRTKLVSIENTHYLGGGKVWPLGRLKAVSDIAERLGLHVHIDGTRLLNAVVATGITAREYAYEADSVSLSFTKGLGAPIGAVIAGSENFIKEARRYQYALGGVMQQAGIVAAGALYALRHNVDRLTEDHENAKLLAERLSSEEGIDINPAEVETNIVCFKTTNTGMTPKEFVARLRNYGVRMGHNNNEYVRAVTHLGITRKDILEAVDAVHQLLIDVRVGIAV